MKLLSDYCESTPLHGFGFVPKRRHVVELVFWSLAILTCIALTVKDTVSLVMAYLSEQTAVNIAMTYDATTRQFPNATICMAIDRCATLRFGVPSINNTRVNGTFDEAFQNFTSSSQPAFLKAGNVQALKNASIKNPAIVVASYVLLTEMMDFEKNLTQIAPCLVYYIMESRGFELYQNWSYAVDTMAHFYQVNGFDYFNLTRTIASLLCYIMANAHPVKYSSLDLTQSTTPSVENLDMCNVDALFWSGPPPYFPMQSEFGSDFQGSPVYDFLCSHISVVNPSLFENPTDSLLFPGSLYPWGGSLSPRGYFFDAAGGEGLLDIAYGETFVSGNTAYMVGIESVFVALNLSRNVCGTQTLFQCRQACIQQMTTVQRGCIPLSYSFSAPPKAVPCTQRFTYVGGNVSSSPVSPFNPSVWDSCAIACTTPPCTTMSFDFFPAQYYAAASGVSPTISPSGKTYQYIQEFLTMDILTLFVQFGGSIGLWLGGSILAFVHVPVYFAGAAVSNLICRKRKRVNSDEIRATYGQDERLTRF